MTLFFKECKKVICSITFVIYTAVILLMYQSQYLGDNDILQRPEPGRDSYGTIAKEVPEILMPNAAEGLVNEYVSGTYTAYPVGFYKQVRLSEKKKEQMAEIIFEITGMSADSFEYFADGYSAGLTIIIYDSSGNPAAVQKREDIPEITLREDMTYERFKELMHMADELIGGGSKYSDAYIIGNFSRVPKTYEDALAEYEEIFYSEKISPAYARLFCDYMCIDLSIMPVFCGAALADKDRRSQMSDVVNSRRISSARLIAVRFLGLAAVMLVPVALITLHAAMGVEKLYEGYETAPLAFAEYAVCWLVPNILLASAVGMLITEALSPLLAVFVQAAWWFGDVMASAGGLTGNIGSFTLVPRHNSLYGAGIFQSTLPQFICNRIFYSLLSVFLIILTAVIYEMKRRGGINGFFSAYKNRKS